MKKQEFIAEVAAIAGLNQRNTAAVLSAMADAVAQELAISGEVLIPGIGKLTAAHKQARTGRNPRTGQPLEIEAKTVVKFKPAKSLTDSLNA